MKIKIVEAASYPAQDTIAPVLEMTGDNGDEYVLRLSSDDNYKFEVAYGGEHGKTCSRSDFVNIDIIIHGLRAYKSPNTGKQLDTEDIEHICRPILRQMAFIALHRANIQLPLETTWGESISDMLDDLIQDSIEYILEVGILYYSSTL